MSKKQKVICSCTIQLNSVRMCKYKIVERCTKAQVCDATAVE